MGGMSLRTAVVMPVAGHGALLDGALEAIQAQAHPVDEIIVVDDSPDSSMAQIPGVRIVRSTGRGPYGARNLGWRATSADVVLFMDVRSRPRPSWSAETLVCFDDPGVALVGSETSVTTGTTWAERAAARQQIFALSSYLSPDGRPYFPTCNLAVRRGALEEVGGFAERRSGADAELCWQVLDTHGHAVAGGGEVLMDWLPRRSVRQLLEQNFRYGRSGYHLRSQWSPGRPIPALTPSWPRIGVRGARLVLRLVRAAMVRDEPAVVGQVISALNLAYAAGGRVALDGTKLASVTSRLRSRTLPRSA